MRYLVLILHSVLIESSKSGKEKATKQRLKSLMVATFLLMVVLFATSVSWSFERQIPHRIPEDRIIPQAFDGFEKSGTYCEILNDFNSPAYYFNDFDSGMGFAVFMNPIQCAESPYPFMVTDFRFYLYDPDGYHWPVAIQVNIRDSDQGDSCSGPQDILCYEDFSIPGDSAYPLMMTLSLSTPCCVNHPFFLEIIYTEPHDPAYPHPSLLMDDDTFPADTCDNWMILYFDPQYYEWYDVWEPWIIPGDAIIRAAGYVRFRGDTNGDCTIDPEDVLYLIEYLYKRGPTPYPLWVGDVNCDGLVDLADVLYLINYLYKGGPAPGC